uniref:Uncharacterized protein n=1 Tax=uncultured Thiotrichaceae bacterium TaxID=298394 RepID=A0A6S6TIC6_9GAMM|nr:MAG: Unknown protein [uncultured Thiotrichaceae bacterium]
MPLDQRYVVAAFDEQGERLAFISPSFEWVNSARQATIFQSQMDANYFIKKNNLCENTHPEVKKLPNCNHVRSAYVRVEIKIDSPEYDHEDPNKGIVFSFSGIG